MLDTYAVLSMCLLNKKNGLGKTGDILCLRVEETIISRFMEAGVGAGEMRCFFLLKEFRIF